jgi:hypothetical protein
MRRLAVHWLLAIAIAALAPGGYVHALSHVGGEPIHGQKQRKGDAKTHAPYACELCGAYAAVDGGAAPTAAGPLVVSPAAAPVGRPAELFLLPAALTRFASRAPPAIP